MKIGPTDRFARLPEDRFQSGRYKYARRDDLLELFRSLRFGVVRQGALARHAHIEAEAICINIRDGNKVLIEGRENMET